MTRNLAQTMVETNPGTVLAGKYRVEKVLGTGGMGVVVAAVHEQLDERVAIKLLRTERLAQKDAVERALREARTAVKIQSDHVVRVFDVGTLDTGAPYIVMEYLAGCDLAQLLCAEGKLDVADAAAYVRQACDAVSKAHALGIIHRDLKPANLFLAVRDDKSSIKVLDFGISKFVTTDSNGRLDPALTATASVLGSPAYMSPEQLETPRDLDGRTDVWSLGVILFELLTGAHPFVADTLPQLYKKIAEAPAPSVRSIRPDVPRDLDAIVARCLAKRPADRFADAGTLANALAPFAVDAHDDRKIAALAETATASREEIESARRASQGGDRTSSGAGEVLSKSDVVASGGPPPQVAMATARKAVGSRRRWLATGVAAAGLAVAATSSLVCVRADKPSHAAASNAGGASPSAAGGQSAGKAIAALAKPDSVIACPPLAAKIERVDGSPGWLGAAVATIACSRETARMGGRPTRTLIPAELLDLPRMPIDHFPEDAFSSDGAREKAIVAAKARGDAWLDGDVSYEHDEFSVTFILRAGDREVARGTGRAKQLVPAIRTALQPVNAFIPAVKRDDPFLREWFGVRSAEAAEALVDWGVNVMLEWPAKQDCEAVVAQPDVLPSARRVVANWCANGFVDSPERDASSGGALMMSIAADTRSGHRPLESDIASLDAALAKTTDHDERAFLEAAKADVYSSHHDFSAATQAALASINERPDLVTPFNSAWNVLSWARSSSNAAPAAIAWAPWNIEAYCFSAMRALVGDGSVEYMRRNAILASNPIWQESVIEFLVQAGKQDEAVSIASKLPGDPVLALVEAGEGRLSHARELARKGMASDDAYTATYSAYLLSQFDMLLGRPTEGLEPLVKKFLETKPAKLEDAAVEQINLALACANGERAIVKRCFKGLREASGGVVFMDATFLDGAEKLATGDYAGAARAWRGIASRTDWHLAFMHDHLAIAFDRGGDVDNARRIDAGYVANARRFNGAEPAHVREALRAEKRGDVAKARELAKKVIDAWSVMDMDVPAVAEMRKLVARLDSRAREQHDHTR